VFLVCSLRWRQLDLTPIVSEGPPNFWVEVWNDDSHFIRIYRFGRFESALDGKASAEKPAMRVVMRHFAHVYRNYVPAHLTIVAISCGNTQLS
jgi:hypothetical protein